MSSRRGIRITKRRLAVILVVLGASYLISYAGVRSQKLLIHKVGFASIGEGQKRYFHSVTIGDFGIPMSTGSGIWILADMASILYSPLRKAEALFWKVYPREYEFEV